MSGNKKPSFLFIHGAGGTKSKWRLLKNELRNVSATFVDLPGRGDNQHKQTSSIENYANFLSDIIREDVIIVGHSMGGLIGIELASKNSKVRGLVLIASHFQLPVHYKVLDKLKEGLFPEGLFYASYSKKVNAHLLNEEKEEINLVHTQQTFMDYSACNLYKEGKNVFSGLDISILGIYGEEDRLLPEHASKELVETNSKASVIKMKEASHYVMLEQPKEVASVLLEFQNYIAAL